MSSENAGVALAPQAGDANSECNVMISVEETTWRHVPQHTLKITHQSNAGNGTVVHGQDCWHCVGAVLNFFQDVDKLKIETLNGTDGVESEMEFVVKADDLWHRNKECLNDSFEQLNLNGDQFVDDRA